MKRKGTWTSTVCAACALVAAYPMTAAANGGPARNSAPVLWTSNAGHLPLENGTGLFVLVRGGGGGHFGGGGGGHFGGGGGGHFGGAESRGGESHFGEAGDRDLRNSSFSNLNHNQLSSSNFSNTNINVSRNFNASNLNNFRAAGDFRSGWDDAAAVAGAAAVGAAATAVASAEIGSAVAALPGSCPMVNGYYQCGATWYKPQFVGSDVQYVVVPPAQ